MNILFIFSRHSSEMNDSTLTKDLVDEFVRQGNNVYIITMQEKKNKQATKMAIENGSHVLRVRTGNYFGVSQLEKAITILSLPRQFVSAARKFLSQIKFDLILTHTPFVSSHRIIQPLRKLFACKAHLLLWDIFPQSAKDLGIIKTPWLFNRIAQILGACPRDG